MKLTTRVSAFFLTTLAIGLVIYSLVFYSVARRHIDYQFTQGLSGALNSLVAAVEVEETEAKWQPLEHSISFGSSDEFGQIDWIVVGDRKLVVEKSQDCSERFIAQAMEWAALGLAVGETFERVDEAEQRWYRYQRLASPQPTREKREQDEFDELTIVVGRSTIPRDAVLRRLTLLVVLLPLLAWLIAALLGRWMVRHALRPLSSMSQQARSIDGSDFQARLQTNETRDELSDLGATFNRLLARQQVAFEQQRRFAGDAAHELRTPLTVLLGQIDVTLRRPRSESEYKENLQLLRKEAAALQEIVESLLFLARSDGDAATPQLERINLKAWLTDRETAWTQLPRGADLELQNQLELETIVRATAPLLARVVENLVFNALKYSEPGTPVIVRAHNQNGHAVVEVSDSGSGIAESEVGSIFEPFFRSHEARSAGVAGNGLGLAIASRIAKSLGGTLECESKLGQGSCFTLRLPRCISPTSDRPS